MMTEIRGIPATRLGSAYHALLMVALLCAVVGIADAGRALFWLILNGAAGSAAPMLEFVAIILRLAAWGLVAAAAYSGWRRKVFPATWMLVAIPVLACALLAVQRYP